MKKIVCLCFYFKAVLPFVRSCVVRCACVVSVLCMYLISRATLCPKPEDVCVIRVNHSW